MSIGTIITEDGEVLENVKFFTQEEQANLERHKEIMEITRKDHLFYVTLCILVFLFHFSNYQFFSIFISFIIAISSLRGRGFNRRRYVV